jgi:hypothetical protein
MAQPVSIRRILLALVALALSVATVIFVVEFRRLDRQFYEWIDARPTSLPVDLSKPGTYTAAFQQTCSSSHGEVLYLELKPSAGAAIDTAHVLDGLAARLVIADANGQEILNQEITPVVYQGMDGIQLAHFHPFPTGNYTASIIVSRGAAAVQGVEQTVFAQYQLCGLERFPAMIAGALALACGIPALVLVPITARRFFKYGIRARPRSS